MYVSFDFKTGSLILLKYSVSVKCGAFNVAGDISKVMLLDAFTLSKALTIPSVASFPSDFLRLPQSKHL